MNWVQCAPSIVFALFAGGLSDIIGRKPTLLVPLLGHIVAGIFDIINNAFIETLPIEFFYLSKIGGFFGGEAVYYLVNFYDPIQSLSVP